MEHQRIDQIARFLAPGISRRRLLGSSMLAALGARFGFSSSTAATVDPEAEKVFDGLALYGQLLTDLSAEGYQPKNGLRLFRSLDALQADSRLSEPYIKALRGSTWNYSLFGEFSRPDPENASGFGVDGTIVVRLDTFADSAGAKDYLGVVQGAWERDDIARLTDDDHGVGGLTAYTLTSPLSGTSVDSSYVHTTLIVNRTTVMSLLAVGYDNPIDADWVIEATVAAKKARGLSTTTPIGRFIRYPEDAEAIEIRLTVAQGQYSTMFGATPEQIASGEAFASDAYHQYTSAFQFNGTYGSYLAYQTGSVFEGEAAANGYFEYLPTYLEQADANAGNVSREYTECTEVPAEYGRASRCANDYFVYDLGGGTYFGGNETVVLIGNTVYSGAIFTNFPVDAGSGTADDFSQTVFGRDLRPIVDRNFAPISDSELASELGTYSRLFLDGL